MSYKSDYFDKINIKVIIEILKVHSATVADSVLNMTIEENLLN